MSVEICTVGITDGKSYKYKFDFRYNFNKYSMFSKLISAGLGNVWG
jgi:hypothetical protein